MPLVEFIPDWLRQSLLNKAVAPPSLPYSTPADPMTHYQEQPNPARPYIDTANAFFTGGIHGALQNRGVDTPPWMNAFAAFINQPGVQDALGVISPAARTNILNMFKAGRSYQEIARELEISRGQVAGFISRNRPADIPVQVRDFWTPERDQQLLNMIKSGKTYKEAAAELGQTRGNIAFRLHTIRPEEERGVSFTRGDRWDTPVRTERRQPSLPKLKFMEREFE